MYLYFKYRVAHKGWGFKDDLKIFKSGNSRD